LFARQSRAEFMVHVTADLTNMYVVQKMLLRARLGSFRPRPHFMW